MSHRSISGLAWAKPCWQPKGLGGTAKRGKKALGVRYERDLAKALPRALHGQWWEFSDRNGLGHCQTDLILPLGPGCLAVLEAKYTWVEAGHTQIEQLYRPVVTRATGKSVLAIQVCKVLVPGLEKMGIRVTSDLDEALDMASRPGRVVLHWIGIGPVSRAVPCLRGEVPGHAAPLALATLDA